MRVDAAVETGSTVGTDYDSMIAKVIAHGPDRATALAKLDRALSRTAILGLETNVGFLRSLLARDDVRSGEMDTGLIGRLDPPTPPLSDEEAAEAWASAQLTRRSDDPWDSVDGWRLGGQRAPAYFTLSVNGGEPFDVKVKVPGTFTFAGEWLAVDGWTWHITEPGADEPHHVAGDGDLRAPMPGRSCSCRAASATKSRRGSRSWSWIRDLHEDVVRERAGAEAEQIGRQPVVAERFRSMTR